MTDNLARPVFGIIAVVEILVVDDELSIRRGLAAMLENAGYSVRTARDGIVAFGAIRSKRPDIILLDVMRGRGYALVTA